MRQLTCTAPNRVEWVEVPDPELQLATDALIRPIAVARCEIDPLQILGGPISEGGFALGHEAVAEVLAVGADVGHVRPGDLVVPSFQISCGACPTCAAGRIVSIVDACGTRTTSDSIPPYSMPDSGCIP